VHPSRTAPVPGDPEGLPRPAAIPIVAVGASAGGLEAIQELLRALPNDTGMGFVIVQHLSPTHESMLPEILARSTEMEVVEVEDEPSVEPNRLYVIPPNRSMGIAGGVLSLLPRPEGGMQHRPVDQFFSALAEDRGHRAIGVVLSGTGSDGTRGVQAIKAQGGITFAQDATAQQDSMPRSAIASGCVDFVLAPRDIAEEIVRIAHHPFIGVAGGAPPEERAGRTNLERIFGMLRQVTGVDFTHYKFNTLFRRITRRAVLLKMEGLAEYADHLQRTPVEVEALYQDILISVTSFFRNPESFEALKSKALPRLTQDRPRNDPIRTWVVGCSTGEEAYSVAMTIAEYLSDAGLMFPVQIYATDLNGVAIDRARAGFYPKAISQDITPERLRRFFVELDGGYRISKALRDMCVFARHNALTDPPFSRMDLICCRNLLIYVEPQLQKKLMPVLHYALKPHAFLMLGGAETIGTFRDLFDLEDVRSKLYSKRSGKAQLEMPALIARGNPIALAAGEKRPRPGHGLLRDVQTDVQREADRVLMSRYAPAGVLVNADLEVLQFRGHTGVYLAPAPGRASLNLLKMAREGLLVSLRSALHRVRKEGGTAREEGVRIKSNGGFREVDVVVIPVKGDTANERCYLVLFEDPAARRPAAVKKRAEAQDAAPGEDKDGHLLRLTQELAATREYLQSVIEQQDAANEELQSANEEVQSANEELQSINEELETSKEEIQSSNEELTTVNEELQNRNEELNRANNDLTNLLLSVQLPIVMVWPDLRIRRFTPTAERVIGLIPSDVGRPIGDIKFGRDVPDLTELVREVIDTVSVRELEVRDKTGRWHWLRIRPYRTMDNRIDGAVIVLVDIHDLKQSQEGSIRQARILERTHEPIIVREPGGEIVYWNRGAEQLYGYAKQEAVGRNSHELLQTSGAADVEAIEDALAREGKWSGELTHRTRGGETLVVESSMAVVSEGEQRLVIETNRDMSQRKALEDSLRKRVSELAAADRHKNQFLAMLAHELRNPLAPMRNAIDIMRAQGSGSTNGESIDMLHRQVSKMARIVDDLLEVARITHGQIQLRKAPVVLQEIVRNSVETVQPAMGRHGLDLHLALPAEPLLVQGDATRLEQVVCNLLENAVKFTPDAGRIAVEVRAEQARADARRQAVVSVRDSGVGIQAEMLWRVFDLFVQADESLARSSGGLGIGLSLVRALVEGHDGSVTAHSDGIGRGSEFVVRLPLIEHQPAPAQVRPEQPPVRAAIEAERVLVVDDNADFLSSMAVLLELAGVPVRTAGNGPEALRVATEFQPSSVLLDVGLPGMNGYEVARRLREQPGLDKALLIAITGYGSEADVSSAREAGFDHHLVKPVEVDEVLALLGRCAKAVPE
jgi:two-component system CheB/CheR fusion protein